MLGPCGEYRESYDDGDGAEPERAKPTKKKKGKKEHRRGSDGDAADGNIEADGRVDGRVDEREEIDEADSESDRQTDDPGEEERGFLRGMRQFFGFGGDESEE
jgi:hypothetical protein